MAHFPDWKKVPIPGLSLSASGLLALADLSTVAQRTVISGGASWLDSLILVPGLHYQQAADELGRWPFDAAFIDAVEDGGDDDSNSNSDGGHPITFRINNAATAVYIQKIARPGQTVTLDVGCLPMGRTRFWLRRSQSGMHADLGIRTDLPDLGWVSHLLYLCSPLLTIAALVLVILLQDWWALASLLAYMVSRFLNIWVIKQRAKQPAPPIPPPSSNNNTTAAAPDAPPDRVTEYRISLGGGTTPRNRRAGLSSPSPSSNIRLRGLPADLQAITADAWLRSKTHAEGYLEATAKLIVYMVAAFSGNESQAGSIVTMALLLANAALLALSNANAKALQVNGRVMAPE
ncbi:hypothetical protein B0T26DRAFT_620202, partial [Lasiosphaeria miniovina]